MTELGPHGGFTPNRNLLNPKFDSYVLSALDQNKLVSSHTLPAPIAAPAVPNSVYLPFHDVEYRIRHNHLTWCLSGRLVYVSASYEVIAIHLDPVTAKPKFTTIIALPKPLDLTPPLYAEYPAVRSISGNILAISDGSGQIHVVEAESPDSSGSGVLLGSFRLSTGEEDDILPFRLHHARLKGADQVQFVISVSTRITAPGPSISASTSASSSKAAPKEHTSYRLMSVSFPLPKHPHPGVQQLTVDWALTSSSLPLFFTHDPQQERYIIASATPFSNSPSSSSPPDPQEDEISPIPRPGENLNPVPPLRDARPPPYSWTQTYDSVTVVFPLPASTPKTSIRVLFSEKNLTLLVSSRDQASTGATDFPLPVYVRKPLWDGIHPDTSYWTWDKEGDRPGSSIGLLSLHLDKMHEDTRWSHVFQPRPAGTAHGEEEEEEDVEVPETVDPSELANIRDQLEKYTSDLASSSPNPGLGGGALRGGIPSLLDGEMDEELDEQVGSKVVWSYVGEEGGAVCPAPGAGVEMLSVPFERTGESVVVKYTLDGLVFDPPGPPALAASGSKDEAEEEETGKGEMDGAQYEWTHTATYPALAFVLASKRDVKFTYHHSSRVCFAFEGGTGKGTTVGGNVYMYKGQGEKGGRNAGQAVVRVSGGEKGALMGVQLVQLGEGEEGVLVCLCEREVVVVRDVLGW